MSKKDSNIGRSSNWNFILYPESAPENWVDIINETHIEWVSSPLHDKDTNPDGEIKKAHYHITLLYPSLKSYSQVTDLVVDTLKCPIPIKCNSVKGSIRYMVHKDNPEKFQYCWNDIKCYGGVDLQSLCAPTHTERMLIQKDIIKFVRDNEITEFEEIVNIALDTNNDDWLNVLMNFSTLSISTYIRSVRFRIKKIYD